MSISRGTRIVLTVFALIAFAFIYVPLGVILINSFSVDKNLTWPPSGFTTTQLTSFFVNIFFAMFGPQLR